MKNYNIKSSSGVVHGFSIPKSKTACGRNIHQYLEQIKYYCGWELTNDKITCKKCRGDKNIAKETFIMNIYNFKLHPQMSYANGLIVIAAKNFDDAEVRLRSVTKREMYKDFNELCYPDRTPSANDPKPFVDEDALVMLKLKALKDEHKYRQTWYVSTIINDVNYEPGFVVGSYHDG